ncbi:unnamed protein product [Strongylus vulgaris]|uniref:SCP domain-containing protein n=1 Tax=Strongylus vulgaris TaxID=40348 RepID=A0A3P7JFW5_STRVU|nr:unnamed protein product [Strongylus vulgaris]
MTGAIVLVTILSVYTYGSYAATFNCTAGTYGITDDNYRQIFLDFHNEKRKELATRNVVIEGKHLPRAKNMYKMEYSCELEKIAEAAASMDCSYAAQVRYKDYGHSFGDSCELEKIAEAAASMDCSYAAQVKYKEYGHSFGDRFNCPKYPKSVSQIVLPDLLKTWWQEGRDFDGVDRRYDSWKTNDFINVINGQNTHVGCALYNHSSGIKVWCAYET